MKTNILESKYPYFAARIMDSVFKPFYELKITLFIAGKGNSAKSNTVRNRISDLIRMSPRGYQFDIIFPENIFESLMFGPKGIDLLRLENMLADSVDIIILVLEKESPGVIAELGAFVNVDRLRPKIICIQDNDMKKKKSFINYGPIKLLKKHNKNQVIYFDFNNISEENISKLKSTISSLYYNKFAIRKITSLNNVLDAKYFLLPCFYLFAEMRENELFQLYKYASSLTDDDVIRTNVTTGIDMLLKDRLICLEREKYTLTEQGEKYFLEAGKIGKHRNVYDLDEMDRLRLEIMKYTYT